MKMYREESLRHFEFWSGAKQVADELTYEELDAIEAELESLYPDGMDETDINDFFWFEEDTIADWLGFGSWEGLCRVHAGLDEWEDDEEEEEEEDDEEEEE